MTKEITIPSHDGKTFMAYAAYPETDRPAPGVLVIQEIFGVNRNIRHICDSLAQAGYLAYAPDIFWRLEPGAQLDDRIEADWAKGFKFFDDFDVDLGIEDLKSTLAALRRDKSCTGRAGTMGFCLGGKLAYLMATRSDADCNVSYYGVGIQDFLDEAANIKKPLLMHIAEKDKYVPLEAQSRIRAALNRNEYAEVNLYEGVDHAFAREGGAHYDKEAAHRANFRTADFLATCLTTPKTT